MSETSDTSVQPIRLFYSYAHEDEPFRHTLDKHLSVLRRTGVIAPWHDRRISPGGDWAKEIDRYLDEAQLILLLVSADFLSSDYCWGIEMERALARHDAGLARVIPIMVRPVDFEGVPFARLQALPRQAKPITQWRDQDAAWADVAKGIRQASHELREQMLARAAVISRPPEPGGYRDLDAESLNRLYAEYWEQFSEVFSRSGVRLRPPTPTPRNYVTVSLGSSDMRLYTFVSVRDRLLGVELVMRRNCAASFAELKRARREIEQEIGEELDWRELSGSYRIVLSRRGYNLMDRTQWGPQHDWLIERVKVYQQVLLSRLGRKDDIPTKGQR